MPYDVPEPVIRRAQCGDLAAQAVIAQTFQHPFTVTVRRFLESRYPGEAEDFVQEIFLRILKHLPDFDFSRKVKFSTWVYTFARNFCFDKLKSRRPRMRPLPALSRNPEDEPLGDWVDDGLRPESHAQNREFRDALERALDELPDDSRRIFHMRETQGLEFNEIAALLRQPLGTVKSKHYRACARLRGLLDAFRPPARLRLAS